MGDEQGCVAGMNKERADENEARCGGREEEERLFAEIGRAGRALRGYLIPHLPAWLRRNDEQLPGGQDVQDPREADPVGGLPARGASLGGGRFAHPARFPRGARFGKASIPLDLAQRTEWLRTGNDDVQQLVCAPFEQIIQE